MLKSSVLGRVFGALIISQALLAASARAEVPPIGRRPFAGSFAVTLDGKPGAIPRSLEGGMLEAEVVSQNLGGARIARKSLGSRIVSEVHFVAALNTLGKNLMDWVGKLGEGNSTRVNGAIVECDTMMKAVATREFSNALITEVGIPAMDASSKEVGLLNFTFAPEMVRTVPPAGTCGTLVPVPGAPGTPAEELRKPWLTSNFRVEIPGLDTSRVSQIEPLTLKQKIVSDTVGEHRDPSFQGAQILVPDLVLTVSGPSAESFAKWHEDFVVRGNSTEQSEKNGAIILLSADQKEVARVNLSNMGIFRLEQILATGEAVRKVRVSLYVEQMSFQISL